MPCKQPHIPVSQKKRRRMGVQQDEATANKHLPEKTSAKSWAKTGGVKQNI